MIVNKELAKRRSRKVLDKDKRETPIEVFQPLMDVFDFTLDPCCEVESAKCSKYYTPYDNGLIQDWQGERVFCNPPYSRGVIDHWVKKCYLEAQKPNTFVVALLPVSTSGDWWHDWVTNKAEIRFYRRRIKFIGMKDTAPFSSVLAIYGLGSIQNFMEANGSRQSAIFQYPPPVGSQRHDKQ